MKRPYVICLLKHLAAQPAEWPHVAAFKTAAEAISSVQVQDVIIDEYAREEFCGELIGTPRNYKIIGGNGHEQGLVLRLVAKKDLS